MSIEKRVVITGNQGFIGVWTSVFFKSLGWEVYGIDDRSSHGDRLYDKLDHGFIKVQSGINISAVDEVERFLRKYRPSLVINLAGQAIVPRAFREPFNTFVSNSVGTLAVLDAANRVDSIKAVSFITSDKVYQNNNELRAFRETDELGGKDIYSLSKSTCERICDVYVSSGQLRDDLNIQTIRLGNVVGGGDWSVNRLVPDIVRSILERSVFQVRYINATRPFQHISDVVEGIANISLSALYSKINNGDAWNLGPRDNTYASVNEVLECFNAEWPKYKLKIELDKELYVEDMNLMVDVSKYSDRFLSPKYDSKNSILKTIEWYKGFYDKQEPMRLMIQDINKLRIKDEII